MIQTETHSILGIERTDEKTGDSKTAIEWITAAFSKSRSVDAVYVNGAYDCKNISIFQFCSRKGAEPIIRVRNNARTRARGCIVRANVVWELMMLERRIGKRSRNTENDGRRSACEYSMVKHFFGESVCSRCFEHICTEIRQKYAILNYDMKEYQKPYGT